MTDNVQVDYWQVAMNNHRYYKGKLAVKSKVPLKWKDDLAVYYTPWVATPCLEIAKDPNLAYELTWKNNSVAVVSDGSAVLGLWNIWGLAWLPVMEGKSILFKEFGWVDAVPIVLNTQDPDEIIKIVEAIAPTFGGINLEDIKAPECFYIEDELKKRLNIPVFHDDQHGTAIVVLAWLINALKFTWKTKETIKVVINWVWAAWIAITKLLLMYWVKDIITVDSKGVIFKWRDNLNYMKEIVADITNTACILDSDSKECIKWWLKDAVKWRDVFIGVSVAWALTWEMIKLMNKDPIVFAMANPIPEIMPNKAKEVWVAVIATWRSDFPNQINNVLVFPGIFRWVLDWRIIQIRNDHNLAAAQAIADCVKHIDADNIIPSPFDRSVAGKVAEAVKKVW